MIPVRSTARCCGRSPQDPAKQPMFYRIVNVGKGDRLLAVPASPVPYSIINLHRVAMAALLSGIRQVNSIWQQFALKQEWLLYESFVPTGLSCDSRWTVSAATEGETPTPPQASIHFRLRLSDT